MTGVLSWMLSWIIMIVIIMMLAKSRWGHTIIYYGAWLAVIFLIVTQYKELTSILQGGNISGQ